MIRPGLLTASTSKADHLGMSTDRVACLSMIGAPFAARVFGLGLKTVFPPRRDVGTRVGARTHTRRGGTEWSTQRLCGELCERALVAQSVRRGETESDVSAGMERSGMRQRPD